MPNQEGSVSHDPNGWLTVAGDVRTGTDSGDSALEVLAFHGQAPALIVVKEHSFFPEFFSEDPVLRYEVLHGVPLSAIDRLIIQRSFSGIGRPLTRSWFLT